MAFSENLRFECVHCGNCCCDLKTIVNITNSDIIRIKQGLNFTIEELLEVLGFYIYDEKPTREKLLKMVIPPIQTEKGLAFIGLRKLKSGICIFYNPKKKRCSIYKVRPNFCRTFPFYFYSEKSDVIINYTKKGLEYCQGISDNFEVIDNKYWLDLGKRVLLDLIQNEKFINQWNQNINKEKIKPMAKEFLLSVFKKEPNDKTHVKLNE
jgi:Fe-S-cluster containining protein